MNTGHADRFEVDVIYNGIHKQFQVTFSELIRMLIEQAVRVFGITQNAHLLGLFTHDNRELADNDTIRAAGVHARDRLNLRPSAVRGG